MSIFHFPHSVLAIEEKAQEGTKEAFGAVDTLVRENTRRLMEVFHQNRVSEQHFHETTGYGLGDRGREVLDNIYAQLFGGEEAYVRIGLVSGTHAITAALFGNLKPGETLLYVTGKPYDTLHGVIGLTGKHKGSLADYGISYKQVDVLPCGSPDFAGIKEALADKTVAMVAIQRSKGYANRKSWDIETIGGVNALVKEIRGDVPVFVDNCYGEFVETREPLHVGVDLIAGSLIKNPGGGLVPAGGYVAGRADLVEGARNRATAPGLLGEYGANLGQNRLLYQGLFFAPHVVGQALKTAIFTAACMEEMGFMAEPSSKDRRTDIVQSIQFPNSELLCGFCEGIQAGAPVDSFVTPVPGEMPGYDSPVIMAAGAFHQGASIELSADAPLREPYTAYLQGGLTFESARLGVLTAVHKIQNSTF